MNMRFSSVVFSCALVTWVFGCGPESSAIDGVVSASLVIASGPTLSDSQLDELTATSLSVVANGSGTLAYEWSQDSPAEPRGVFEGADLADASWTAPGMTGNPTSFVLRLTVTDDAGDSATGTVSVTVDRWLLPASPW